MAVGHPSAAIRLERTQTPHAPIPATVFVAEPLGRDTVIETRVAAQAVTVKVPGLIALPPATPVWLGIDAADLRAFDKRTGAALLYDSGSAKQLAAAGSDAL